MKKRCLALFLCLLMAGTSFSCGDSGGADDTMPTNDDVNDDSDPDGTGIASGVPKNVKFDGETVKIMNACYYDTWLPLLDVSEATSDTVDDAVYKRNLAVMDKLDVKIEFASELDAHNDFVATTLFRQSVLAGDRSWDILVAPQYRMVQLTLEDLFYNMKDADYIDITNPWWYTDYMKSVNINDDLRYMLSGDISLNFLQQISAIYFNKELMARYHGDAEFLYDEVLDGKWTLDRFTELVTDVYDDLNGDQKSDYEDLHGFVSRPNSYTMYTLMLAAGGKITEKSGDSWKITTNLEKNINICEKLYKLIHETTGSYADYTIRSTDSIVIDFPQKFSDGTMLFNVGLLNTADRFRDMKHEFGVIPFPKYDELQESYRSPVQDQAATAAVPADVGSIDMVSAVLEEMAFQGWNTMVPTYYEVALKTKYMRDTEDAAIQIIDLVRDNAWSEIGFVHNFNMNSLVTIPREMLYAKGNNYASLWASKITAAEEKFETLLEFYQ